MATKTKEMMQSKCYILTITLFIKLISALSFHFDTSHSIVYEDVMSNESRGTYFGYSVVTNTGKDHWIHIGVPRGNSSHYTGVREPGIVYQCQIGDICDEVNLSSTANEKYRVKEDLVNAWIGASLTATNGKEDVTVVVCGHRWKDKRYPRNNILNGACYMIPIANKGVTKQCKLVPLSDSKMYTQEIHIEGQKIYISNTGLGQAGISCHYPKKNDDHELILGAPGVQNWQGATVSYKIPPKKKCGDYSSLTRSPDFKREVVYFGYAVSSGQLFPDKDLVYAVSAPRAFEGNGMVLLFDNGDKQQISPIIKIIGTQLGEYFGTSIATADINQDGYDDLVIGAPRYSTASFPDQGRIYIFLGGEIINREMEYIDGGIKNAQFGMTVTAVGDINNDGFEDIAVGAPYSNGNRGTVYVYTGGKNGLLQAQVIHAAQISPSLKGFGISIHHTTETCKRDKAYLAIGAYLSGHVVVLRSYPGISLHIKLSSTIQTIEKSNHQFLLTVCSWYNSGCGPSKISITRNIWLDPENYRVHTQDENRNKSFHEEMILLQESQMNCNNLTVFIHDNIVNRDQNIVIEASQTLNNYEQEQSTLLIKTNGTKTGTDKYCKNCSVVNQETSKLSHTLKLPFSDCGVDGICESELHLQCSFRDIENGSFVIGSSSEMKLRFLIMNIKEPAYQTILNVQIPEPAKRLRLYRNCYETIYLTETILHCNLKSPLDDNDTDEFIVEIDMSRLADKDLSSITFNSWLNTTSVNTGSFSRCALELELKATANMRMIGKSTKEVMSYSHGSEVNFEQTFQIYKVGDSPVRKAETIIRVPYLLRISDDEKMQFLNIIRFQATQGRYQINCESDGPLRSSSSEVMPEFQEMDGLELVPSRSERDVMNSANHTEMNKDFSVSTSDNILYLNCTNNDIYCQKISCTSGFTDSKALLNIKFIGKLNTSALGNLMKTKNIILLSTEGRVDVKEPKNLLPYDKERRNMASATISFVLEISEKKVEMWVIAVSAVSGIIVLVVIIIVLMKVGFFKREKKEALKNLVAATIAEDIFYRKGNDPIPSQQLMEANESTGEILASNEADNSCMEHQIVE